MKYLLDTHAFMWWDADSEKLSSNVFEIISDDDNDIYLSVVSVWEIAIKNQIGKLPIRSELATIITEQQTENGIQILSIELAHTLKISELPLHHNDPFDRLLIAQSLVENIPILSKDAVFQKYDAEILW